jgi:5,10-methylenetetrahydromethanopterin reductase
VTVSGLTRSTDVLGCYVVPGGVSDPKVAFAEASEAERLGLGTVWIGERYDTKDLPSLAGALGVLTSRVRIAAGVTHPGLRHPMVLASMGQTLQSISGGRFVLGLGRSAMWRWNAYGVPAPTLASLGDTASILRRLWAGETVTYDGPAGRFPLLRLPQRPDVPPPPVVLAAVGPKTLQLAGEFFDGVILHPFLTPEAVGRSVKIVRDAAERAGRDPNAARCFATVVTASDLSAEDEGLAVGSRAAGYFHVSGLGDAIVAANEWSADALAKYRAHPTLVSLGDKTADKHLSRTQLVELSQTLPSGWLASSSAAGSSGHCANRLRAYLDAGADELVLHGSTAPAYGSLVRSFASQSSE